MAEAPAFAEVIVTLPVDGRFHYEIPSALRGALSVGHRVLVPFGRRKITGFVVGLSTEAPADIQVRPILERLDEAPLVSAELLEVVRFASEYYLASAGEILKIALPPGITAASSARFKLTAAGRAALAAGGLDPAEARVLSALAGARGQKRAEVPRAQAEQLEARGLIARHDPVHARAPEARVEYAERTTIPVVLEALGRAHVQRRILERLTDGPLPVDALADELGRAPVRRALKLLVADDWVRVYERRAPAAPATTGQASGLTLTGAQAEAVEAIDEASARGAHASFLLRGVTGSGKTEVYLRAIERVRARGKGAIVLVPEIALTAQLEARFTARFGNDVVLLHSAMTDVERRRGWERLRAGEAHIALGPRSAVWAPVASLGIVVVDEEHDPSFKQHNDVRYHGRDLAIFRAHRAGAVAVLGSATPSLESRYAVESGRMRELRLPVRATGSALPEVQVVDLAKAGEKHGEVPILTRTLADALRATVARGEQAIVFLNRRGFNTVVVCGDCQTARTCARCAVSLTHHKGERTLVCHYCGHKEPFAARCAKCGQADMKPYGAGTERVTEAVLEELPDARVLRLDRDVTHKVGALDETLDAFRAHEADVLVGTQMVTKGHDFPKVTLVGIVCADTSLAFPDFRAAERTFQLITQVAGRAGRAELPGRVVVQTFQPEHYAVLCALHHDDEGFFQRELEARRSVGYPPLTRLGMIRVEGADEGEVARAAAQAARWAAAEAKAQEAELRGPALAPIAKIKDRHRWMTMIRAPTPSKLLAVLRAVRARLDALPRGVSVLFDVDAVDML